ncbi:MAG: hypothetical protein M9962_13720 [Oligoflexia bacterium]|nr:hypothetical protein [Oligoflexia bacterium]
MDLETGNSEDKKGLWERAKEVKDAALERLKGAEQVALEAIEKAQNDVVAEVQASAESIKETVKKADDLAQKAQENLTKAEEGSTRINSLVEQSSKTIETINSKSEETKNAQLQIQALLKTVETSEADAKAHLKELVTTKAEMKNQFTEIGQFYSEIGERKNELLEMKKKAATDLTELSTGFSAKLDVHEKRTEDLVTKNEKIEEEIEAHLQRAVGASLFSAFGTRKNKIVIGKWVWAGLFVLAIVGAFLWVNSMISGLKGPLDTAFVVRTVFGVLIGYFVYFCSKQYDRERRAEEEYAFKSAISISLKPFHDLLINSKNEQIDDIFMKQLMEKIFDNPVDRLFSEGKTTSKIQINGQGLNGEHCAEPPVSKK